MKTQKKNKVTLMLRLDEKETEYLHLLTQNCLNPQGIQEDPEHKKSELTYLKPHNHPNEIRIKNR